MAAKKTTVKKKTTTKKAPTKKSAPKKSPAKPRKQASSAPKKRSKCMSLLDAAAAQLAKAKEPMSCPEMVEAAAKAKTWSSSGKTPAATLSAAIHREIKTKGKEARFAKAERGRFRLTAASAKRSRSS